MQQDPSLIIAAMLSGFPASAGTDVDLQIRAYLMAIEDIEYEAIALAGRAFIKGEVKDHNRAFAPSCAEFAERCRYHAAVLAASRRPKIEAQEKPEDKAPRVQPWKMRLLANAQKGDAEAIKKLSEMFPALNIEIPNEVIQQIEGEAAE